MNLNYQFYQKYYEQFDPREFTDKADKKSVADRNTTWIQARNSKIYGFKPECDEGRTLQPKWYSPGGETLNNAGITPSFSLQTTYPGLILGTGYKHETSSLDEITIGFYFDYTTGLPIIPGSSVKGILRSAFPRKELLGKNAKLELQETKYAYLRKCLKHVGAEPPAGDEWIDRIETDIFTEQRDIFFEATITAANPAGELLGPDFITPHGDNPLKNPVPLRMVKVLPEVSFSFSFRLSNTVFGEDYTLTAVQKQVLFRILLLVSGVGAKTNVGYGRLVDPTDPEAKLPYLELEEKDIKALEGGQTQTNRTRSSGGESVELTSAAEDTTEVFQSPEISFFRGTPKPGRSVSMEAVVTQLTPKPMVKVYFRKDNMPVAYLLRPDPRIKIGDVVFVTVQMSKKKTIPNNQVTCERLK
jgi:CRISPR-associated protein Cmr6